MSGTYTNPVYDRNFPDPFVLRFNGRYYAYGTGPAGDGRFYPVLSSTDLVHWEEHGGAIEPLDIPGAEEYWAPEDAYADGVFHLYHAVGRTESPDHHLRLATAPHPLGPWTNRDVDLTPQELFAIDASPFQDPADGQWYLFYANDVLAGPYAGTGIVVDRLLQMDCLAGDPQSVLRPFAEWQIFERRRAIKQNLDWYTVEGPFVRKVGERYICFYSGGRWENPNYGVGFAVAEHPLGPWSQWGEDATLRTVPGRVIGPGHNSVVVGPDLLTDYIVYHGWDPGCTARYLRIDPLTWPGGLPACAGASSDTQPVPHAPDLLALFDPPAPGSPGQAPITPAGVCLEGRWSCGDGGIHTSETGAALSLADPVRDAVLELSFRHSVRIEALGVSIVTLNDHWHTLRMLRSGGTQTLTMDGVRPAVRQHSTDPLVLTIGPVPGKPTMLGHLALTGLRGDPTTFALPRPRSGDR
jgi:GH43 family beta-xylosidase